MINALLVASVYLSLFMTTIEPISGLLGLIFTLYLGFRNDNK